MSTTSKVALISTYCDTEKKLFVLENTIKKIKEAGVDVIVISPFYLKKEIVDLCDYFFVTKDNPVLDWPIKSMFYWKIMTIENKNYYLARTFRDVSYAGLVQIKQLSNIALQFDYEQFYHMIYDVKIDDTVYEGINLNVKSLIYKSKRNDEIWDAGFHFMIFNREELIKFISEISFESFMSHSDCDALTWLSHITKKLNLNVSEKYVEDLIYFFEGFDFFNFSPIEQTKIFIHKNDEVRDNIKLLFYDVIDTNFTININNANRISNINNNTILDLGFNQDNMLDVHLIYNNQTYDLTKAINNLKHSVLSER